MSPSCSSIPPTEIKRSHLLAIVHWILCTLLLGSSTASAIAQSERFAVVKSSLTWQEAKADAESKGGHLATFSSLEEWDNARITISAAQLEVWIGGRQPPGSKEPAGGWNWITGEPWSFTAWLPGEPNQNGTINEDALEVSPLLGWNDAPSSSKISYLIEFEGIPLDNSYLTNGLVVYLPFAGDASDKSGNGNDGIVQGANLALDRLGSPRNAYYFGGASRVVIPAKSGLAPDSGTVSLWVKANSWATSDQYADLIGKDGLNGRQWILQALPDGRIRSAVFTSTGSYIIDSVQKAPVNQWIHLVQVWDRKQLVAYLNGVELLSGPAVGNLAPGTEPVSIGGNNVSGSSLDGFIDEVRIYNRALSGAEITALFHKESPPAAGIPRSAAAIAQVVNGFVVGAFITDGGIGYTNAPTIEFSGGGGSGATAIATIDSNGAVSSISITSTGKGYQSAPSITLSLPPFPPRRATAVASIVNGFVTSVSISDPGFGYSDAPNVILVGGGGSGASAIATVANGVVTAVNVISPGFGYTSNPIVKISSPPFSPTLSVDVSKVKITLAVVQGRRYQLESSTDSKTWSPVGIAFVAEDELINQEFDVYLTGRFFRVAQLP